MREACSLIWAALVRLFRSRASLLAEILVLRHQINIQRRHLPARQTFGPIDRLIFAGLYRLAPTILNALAILKPETVMEWHRVGFRSFWRWKSSALLLAPLWKKPKYSTIPMSRSGDTVNRRPIVTLGVGGAGR